MAFQWTFGRKLFVGFFLAGLALMVVAAAGYRSIARQAESAAWVSHTHQVRDAFSDLGRELVDAETGQRGFVITGEDRYLAPYTSALEQIRHTFERVQRLTSDSEVRRRLERLLPMIEKRLAILADTIELRRTRGAPAAIAAIQQGDGKDLMDRLRQELAEMDQRALELLELRAAEAEESERAARDIILIGSLFGLLAVALVGWRIARSLSTQVGSAVGHIQSSSAELQAAANQQASGAREQATAMSQIATTISELLATSRQISESARRVAQIAEETAASARSGDTTVELGHQGVAGIRRQVDLIVSHMLELGQKSQHIGSVLDIVSELAEQTNILAINATIEAVGAGDAGKRFAVVAEEIRKLADRVAGSTKEIRGLIDDIRSAANAMIMTTETGSKAVDANSKQFGEVAAAFERIRDLVATTTEAAKEIHLSTQQQSAAAEQVNAGITSIAEATREAESSTSQTFVTATQLARLSSELLRIVQPGAA
jgi:methyl-accepting chemotaxis protein